MSHSTRYIRHENNEEYETPTRTC